MTEAIAVGLAVALVAATVAIAILAVSLQSIWKRKDARDEDWLKVSKQLGDATRNLESATIEIEQGRETIARLDKSLLYAAKLYDQAVKGHVAGMPAGTLLDVIRGLPPDEKGGGAGGGAKPAPAAVPQPPTAPAKKKPHLGLVEDLGVDD